MIDKEQANSDPNYSVPGHTGCFYAWDYWIFKANDRYLKEV